MNESNIKYGCYGYNYNIRKEYEHLPFQKFWTWLTGKGVPLEEEQFKEATKKPSEGFLLGHLFFTWSLILLSIFIGSYELNTEGFNFFSILIILFAMVIIVNRFRSLQAIFHYLTHNTMLKKKGKKRGRLYALLFITTPMLYIDWDNYTRSHVHEHHNLHVLCTDEDPDQVFIRKQGIKKGMSEFRYWVQALFNSFSPKYLLTDWIQIFKDVFINAPLNQKIYSALFWFVVLIFIYNFNLVGEFLVMYCIPRFLLFPHSMWLQLFTEHLWLKNREEKVDKEIDYGKLTWGRFQGRPIPKSVLGKLKWSSLIILSDIPVRLYIYPQDLPNHDFHHRMPNINYKNIANIRATMELYEDKYGNYFEVWGFMSSLKIIRDHLCYEKDNLFS